MYRSFWYKPLYIGMRDQEFIVSSYPSAIERNNLRALKIAANTLITLDLNDNVIESIRHSQYWNKLSTSCDYDSW